MFEIRELTGQAYRDVYAGQQPESEPVVQARVGHVDDADEHADKRELASVGS